MPDTVDEMCAGANIFALPEILYASTGFCSGLVSRLTIGGIGSRCVHGRVGVDVSTFTDASANVHMYTQLCAEAYMSVNASACVHRRVRGNILVRTSLLHCLRHFLLLSPASGGREGEILWSSHRCLELQLGQFGN